MDSTRVNQTVIAPIWYSNHVWRNSLPPYASDDIRGAEQQCASSFDWNYGNVSCWSVRYPICGTGRSQSPININSSTVVVRGSDNFIGRTAWHPLAGLRVANSGKSLWVNNEQMGYVMLVGRDGYPSYYQLTQFNLHMPSEHMVDGRQFAAELSIAHKSQKTVYSLDAKDVLITTFFFSVGKTRNPLLDQLLGQAPTKPGQWAQTNTPVDLLRSLGPALEGNFYRYNGSITAPPCAEMVKYFVFERALNMGQDQWLAFKAMFPSPMNNRPAQPLYGRSVSKNSFVEGSLEVFDFYLTRHNGRDRAKQGPAWIIAPCIATLIVACIVMRTVFVKEDPRRKLESAGGLVEALRPQSASV